MAQLLTRSSARFTSCRVCPVSGPTIKRQSHPSLYSHSFSRLSIEDPHNINPVHLLVLANRRYSTSPFPLARPTPWIRYCLILASTLGLGCLSRVVFIRANESTVESKVQKPIPSGDPIESLLPENLNENTAHITQKSNADLLRSYLTMLMCEIPGVATHGPKLLAGCITLRDHAPVIGPLAWRGLEWIIYNTFFTHYVGGEFVEDCKRVIESMYNCNVGTLLNYSVEASDKPSASGHTSNNCQMCNDSMQAISQAVETLADCSTASGQYEIGSAKMQPIAVAIKISGLVNDPYLFQRASENLASNKISPFRAEGEVFPSTSNHANHSDPLSQADHATLRTLMNGLRGVCQKAKAANIVLMMDAEYSWFQPALDRIVTFLSAEFNQVPRDAKGGQVEFFAPIVFNTFQTLLRSTPARLDAYLSDAQERGYSIGVKLVRGAYLTSETNHWQQQKSQGKIESSEPLPVWGSKSETDECFDTIASSLVSRLSSCARWADESCSTSTRDNPPHPIETSLMIAGHNTLSVVKVLKQLRDKEGLAESKNFKGVQKLHLSDSLRGRLMFAQLYGMADNLTTTLTQVLAPSDSGQQQSQPFVFKYLPFGPVEKVLPYLARRAEENQSILQSQDGPSPLKLERKRLGKEIRKRLMCLITS